ncbi:hypothetical protein ACQX36_09790, partial [Corynebacterium diphtheriae]
ETSHQPTSRGLPRPIRGLLVNQAPRTQTIGHSQLFLTLSRKAALRKSRPRQKDQETRVNAAEAAHQKEYDKLAEQAKHETKEEARRQTEFKKEREKQKQKQKTKHASNAKKPSNTATA